MRTTSFFLCFVYTHIDPGYKNKAYLPGLFFAIGTWRVGEHWLPFSILTHSVCAWGLQICADFKKTNESKIFPFIFLQGSTRRPTVWKCNWMPTCFLYWCMWRLPTSMIQIPTLWRERLEDLLSSMSQVRVQSYNSCLFIARTDFRKLSHFLQEMADISSCPRFGKWQVAHFSFATRLLLISWFYHPAGPVYLNSSESEFNAQGNYVCSLKSYLILREKPVNLELI